MLVEAVDGLEDLKAAGAQGRFLRQYEESSVAASHLAGAVARDHRACTTNLSMAAQQAVTLVLLVWGVHLIDDKVITAGALIGAVMFSGRARGAAEQRGGAGHALPGRARGDAHAGPRDDPADRPRGRHGQYVPRPELSGRVGLHDVGFAYPRAGRHERAARRC